MFDSEPSASALADRDDHETEPRFERRSAPAGDKTADPMPRQRPQERPAEQPAAPAKDDAAKPQTKDKAAADQPQKPKDNRSFIRRRPLLTVSLVALAAILAAGGYVYYDNASHFEDTDDAFIAARQTAIAPQVTGYVTSVPVTDNEHVSTGQVIATIDQRTYVAALDQAKAQVAAAKASIANVQAQTDVQKAQIEASKAQVAQAKAALSFAQQQAARYQTLATKGAGTVESAQQYDSQLTQQDAAVKTAQANEAVAERQVESLNAQLESARASLSTAEAQQETAALNLGYTTIRASEPGRIVQLTAAKGEFAQPGTALTMFVPDDIWVVANFKETQLDHMRPGQPVTVNIDAYPDHVWQGHVASVQPGSGTAFSLLPAQNATGNYVKIVQRVPVKIILDNVPPDVALGPGMSVEPSVRVDPTPSIWERLNARYDAWRRG